MSQMPPEYFWWQQVQKTQAEQAGQQAALPAESRTNPWADTPGAASYSGTAPVAQGGPPRSYGDMGRELDAQQAERAQQQGNSPAWLHEYINSPAAKQQVGTPDKQMSDPEKASALEGPEQQWNRMYSKEGFDWMMQDPSTWEEGKATGQGQLSTSPDAWKGYGADEQAGAVQADEKKEPGGIGGFLKAIAGGNGGG
jgi:hypothetical protein